MLAEQIRQAIPATPRAKLGELSAALWKGHGAGLVSDDDAQALAEAIQALKKAPAALPQPRRVGSRPQAPESLERRRRRVASGWLPPTIAAWFTMAETAVLAVIAAEATSSGSCRLTLGHIAALAGVCKATVRKAVREAQALGLLISEEHRLTAFRNAPNTVRIVSREWNVWLRMRAKSALRRPEHPGGGGSKSVNPSNTYIYNTGKARTVPSGEEAGNRGKSTPGTALCR